MTTNKELQIFLDERKRKVSENVNEDKSGKMPYCANCTYKRDGVCVANNKRRVNLSLCAEAWNNGDDNFFYGVYLVKGGYAKVTKSKTIERSEYSNNFAFCERQGGFTTTHYVKEDLIFFYECEADYFAEEINSKIRSFGYVPYVDTEYLIENYKTLKDIENAIDKELCRYSNYNGIDFCDVSAGGIQIRLHHKEIGGYTVGQQFTLKYDLSNLNEAIEFVVAEFKRVNTSEYIKEKKDFIRIGEATGWH